MTEKKCNLFRYIASAILILQVIAIAISGNVGGSNLLLILANVIMAICLLLKKDKIFSAGIVVRVIHIIIVIIDYIIYLIRATGVDIGSIWLYYQRINHTATFVMQIVSIVAYLLILFSLFNISKYHKLGIIAVALLFATDIVPEVFEYGFTGIISGLIGAIFSSVPIALAVLAIQNSSTNLPIVMKKKNMPSLTTGEKLTKLKELLDMGAITQEEFDEKKKELLNL